MVSPLLIRPASPNDGPGIWSILEPMLRAGETYTLPAEMSESEALAYWRSPTHSVFVAEDEGAVRLWQRMGFDIVGRLPDAFRHPRLGFVDALVMFKRL